jgi:putative lipoprotein
LRFWWAGLTLMSVVFVSTAGGQERLKPCLTGDSWLGRDKAAHFALSLAMTGYGYHLLRYERHQNRELSRNASAVVSLSWGLSKEAKDAASPKGHFCFKDLAADILGIAAGMLIFTTQ